jgi:hypothetical protein
MPIRLSDIPEQSSGPVRLSDVPDQIQPEPAKPINTGGDFGFGLSDYETNALKHFGVSLASGSLKGSAGALNAVRQLSNLTGRLLGQDVESPEWKNAKRITDYAGKFDELATRLDKYNEQTGASKVTTIPGQVIGQLPASVLQWEGNIPLAAAQGFEQAKAEGKGTAEALGSGVKSGIERAVLGKALKVLGRVENAVVRRGGSAVALGGASALHGGTLEDILTQAGVGAVISGKTRAERPVETRRVEPVTPQPPETPTPLGNEKPENEFVKFEGVQEGSPEDGIPDMKLYTLKQGIPGHPAGSTLAEETLLKAGVKLPETGAVTVSPQGPGPSGGVPETGKMYHGSPKQNLTEIKPGFGDYGKGIYFTVDKIKADEYSKGRKNIAAFVLGDTAVEPKLGTTYEIKPNIKNPLVIKDGEHFRQLEDAARDKYGDLEKFGRSAPESKAIAKMAKEQGYDAVIDSQSGEGIYFSDVAIPTVPPQKPPTVPPVVAPGAPEPPPEPGKIPQTPVESTVEKLTNQIKQTLTTQVEARKKLNILYSKERGKRSQEYTDYRNELMAKRGMTAGEATAEASKKFSGELVAQEDLPKGLAPELTDAEWNQLEQVSVEKFPEAFRSNEQMNAVVAIGKIRRGEVLQENEIKLIADMFGAKLARILKPAHSLDSLLTHMADWTGVLTKSIKLGGDVSQTFWNLAPVLYHDAGRFTTAIARGELSKARHQDYSWAKAVRRGWGSFFSQEKFDAAQKAVSESPYFTEAIEHGLAQTEMGEFTLRPNREESFPSKIAAKWPLIKQGNRAQVAMGNTARQNLYDLVREQWKKSGVPVTDARLTKLANFCNNLSSRSTVPGGKTVAGLFNFLNITMTSPRNVLARIKNFATGFGTISRDPEMRKLGATTMAGWAATTIAAAVITKIMGADIEVNPLSADFMKAKWGNHRIDLLPGYGPLIRFMARMAVGETKTAAGHYTDKERKKIVEQFVKGWRSPLLNIAVQGWTGRDYQGQPIEGIKGWSKTMADDFLFLWVMDGVDAFKENSTAQSFLPALGAALPWVGMSWAGINVQTYPETAGTTETITRDKLAKEQYGKNWEDLNPLQQRRVERTNKAELQAVVTASKAEAAKKNSYDYVGESIGRAKEAGHKIVQTLSPESQKALSDLGITIGLEAEVSKWKLNKERYERYQELVGEELRTRLDRATANPNWNNIRQTRREERIAEIIKVAKERAGNKIQREARRN